MRVVKAAVAGSVVLGLAGFVGGCSEGEGASGGDGVSGAAVVAAEARAAEAAQDLVGTLLPELQGAMESGGVAAAIGVCAERAQELTAEVQGRHEGVRIRRTALLVRNPVNQPDAYEREWMESVETPAAEARVVGDELRYLQPLVMGELCLKCHGPVEGIDPGVRAVLAERYPDDEAVGFALGELRGVVSVRVGLE